MVDFAERYELDYYSLWLWENDLETPPDNVIDRLAAEVARDYPDE